MVSRVHAARVTVLHMKAARPAQQKLCFCNSHVGIEVLGRRIRISPLPPCECLAKSNDYTIKCKRDHLKPNSIVA